MWNPQSVATGGTLEHAPRREVLDLPFSEIAWGTAFCLPQGLAAQVTESMRC